MDAPDALVDRLAGYDAVVEIGVGRRTDLARALVERGVAVTATDIVPRASPPGVSFVRDDVTDPDPSVYAEAEAILARNLPPELHRPALAIARSQDVALHFTTLGGDQPEIPVTRESLPDGVTLYTARTNAPQ